MQLFVLHTCPRKAARYYADVHVVKILLEAVQLLYGVWHLCSARDGRDYLREAAAQFNPPDKWYRLTHRHHPLLAWLLERRAHYAWTLAHAAALLREYQRRFGVRVRRAIDKKRIRECKTHACAQHVHWLRHASTPERLADFYGEDGDMGTRPAHFCIAIPPEWHVACNVSDAMLRRQPPAHVAQYVHAYRRYYALCKRVSVGTPFRYFRGRAGMPRWI